MTRVAITGIGLCTPLGTGTGETWSALVEGRSAIGPIESYDASSLRTQIGAEINGLRGRDYAANRRSVRSMTKHDVLAMAAVKLALQDAGMQLEDDVEGRNAVFAAGNKQVSDPDSFSEASVRARSEDGTASMHSFGELAFGLVPPLFFIEGIQGASLFYVSEEYSLRGPNTYFSGTAEAGVFAIARGARALRRGEADVAIVGGADSPIYWWHMAAWDTMGVLSGRNQLGAAACAPYDRDRDGTVMGEGSAFFVLEDLDAARARGARIYAEVAGSGAGVDLDELATPDREGGALSGAIGRSLRQAGAQPADVGYVAAHGSGDRLGDAGEAAALRATFGESSIVASSVKGATGNLVAAAGALNVAVAALAIEHETFPPTVGLQNLDPDCDGVDWVAGEARQARVDVAVALASGLEGQHVALVLRRV